MNDTQPIFLPVRMPVTASGEWPPCSAPDCPRAGVLREMFMDFHPGRERTVVNHWCLVHDPEEGVEPDGDDRFGEAGRARLRG